MSATTLDRNTPQKVVTRSIACPVKAAEVIPGGVIVAIDANGYAVNAADGANLVPIGVSRDRADNTLGASGAIDVIVLKGTFKLANNGTNPVVQATLGKQPQVTDNQTVRASGATNDNKAGVVDRLESDGVWVHFA